MPAARRRKIQRKRAFRVAVDGSLCIRPEFHIPQPSFGSIANITPFVEDHFQHPPSLNPVVAKKVYLEAGIRLEHTPQALKLIREHRAVTFEYDPSGFVWVKPLRDDSLRDLIDDKTLKTYLTWSPYHDAYRLRQAGSLRFAKKAFESQGVTVTLTGFPLTRTRIRRIRVPRKINVSLYPFQRRAVEFVLRNDGRACLFDEMGLGKTIMATMAVIELVRRRKASGALIVTPNAVVEQWRNELVEKFRLAPTLVTSRTPLSQRILLYERPLVILNYELLRTDVELIARKELDTLILDEVTRVKNWDTQTSEAVKRLIVRNVIALTGTPLENHLGELYNIVNIVRPGFFGRYHEDFLARYTVKLTEHEWQTTRPLLNLDTLPELRRELGKISIRRTKRQVLRQLPAITMQYVYTEPARNQRILYDILQESLGETILEEYSFSVSGEEGPNPFTSNRLRLYTLLREACADISLIASYLRRKESEHTEDAEALRKSAIFRRLVQVLRELEPENAKLVELKEAIKELVEQDHKVVVFSQFVPIVNMIEHELSNEGITTLVYHGQLSEEARIRTLRDFEKPEYRILASTDAGQFGLNLQAADVVVNYDLPWNPARLQQRIARLHRIGQRNNVLAINFVVKGTVEEHVRDVLERKRRLFRDVTVTDIAEIEELELDELKEIFGFDMRKLADRIRGQYGLRVDSPHGWSRQLIR